MTDNLHLIDITVIIFYFILCMAMGFVTPKNIKPMFMVSFSTAVIGVLLGYHIFGEFYPRSAIFCMIGSGLGLLVMYMLQQSREELTNTPFCPAPSSHPTAPTLSVNHTPSYNPMHGPTLLSRLAEGAKELLLQHGQPYYLAAAVAAAQLLGSFFFTGTRHTPVMIGLHTISAILCFSLCVHEFVLSRKWQERYMPLYFCTVLFVLFAFSPSYMLVLSDYATPWLCNAVFSASVMHLFMGFRLSLLLSLLGLMASWFLQHVIQETYASSQHLPDIYYFFLCMSCIVFVARNKEKLQKTALNQREHWTKMIAHQVMQPITQTGLTAEYLGMILSNHTVLDINNIANDGEPYFFVRQDAFHKVQTVLQDLKKSSQTSVKTIHGLLAMMRDDMENAQDVDIYDVHSCVMEAIALYSSEEQLRIFIRPHNPFTFRASKILIVEVLRNLISNSIAYAGKHALIEIWYDSSSLHIRDNGIGMDEDRLSQLFERPIYASSNALHGMGLGLAFCKKVMDAFGFGITCRSEKGLYTEFILQFITYTPSDSHSGVVIREGAFHHSASA